MIKSYVDASTIYIHFSIYGACRLPYFATAFKRHLFDVKICIKLVDFGQNIFVNAHFDIALVPINACNKMRYDANLMKAKMKVTSIAAAKHSATLFCHGN